MSTATNQYTPLKLHAFFAGFSEWTKYMHTLWLGSTKFPKPLKSFQKPRCQKSDIQEVHPIDGCCSTQDLKIPRVCLWPHTELQVTFIAADTRNAESTCVLEDVHIEIQDTFIIKIKNDILNVHKSAAWYQNYVHIKASLASGYTNRIWRAGQDDIYTCTKEGLLYSV